MHDKDFSAGGLRREIFVRPGKLFTAHECLFSGVAGALTHTYLGSVRQAVVELIEIMTSFTLSLPDETYHRIAEIARIRGISIGDLFDGIAAALVTEADAEARFRARAQRGMGKTERGLELLRKAASADDGGDQTRITY